MTDVIQDGENGLLVAPKDDRALAEALMALLGDENVCKRLGESGRQIVEKRFTVDQMVEGTLMMYLRVMGRK